MNNIVKCYQKNEDRDLSLRKAALGEIKEEMTGYTSIDKPYYKHFPPFQYDQNVAKKTAYQFIKDSAIQNCDNYAKIPAFNYYGRKIYTDTFFKETEKAGAAFGQIGLGEDEVVSMFCLNTPETFYAMYGLNNIGIATEWFNPSAITVGLLHKHITENNVRIIVITELIYDVVKEAIKNTGIEKVIVISISELFPLYKKILYRLKKNRFKNKKGNKYNDERFIQWKEFIKCYANGEVNAKEYEEGKTKFIVHTGGTTGPAKRVAMTDYAVNSAVYQVSLMPIKTDFKDSFCQLIPPIVAFSLEGMHYARYYLMNTHLIVTYDRNEFVDIILKTKANHYFTVPSFVKTLIDNPKLNQKDLSFIKTIMHGGEGIPPEDDKAIDGELQKHGCRTHNWLGFGQNEEFGGFTLNLDIPGKQKAYGSCGIPLFGNDYVILDLKEGHELPYGKNENGEYFIGELCVTGPTIMSGYIGEAESENEKTIITYKGKRYIRTGDQAYIDDDGRLWFYTREQRIIRTQEGKIFANVIEDVLREMPEVSDCCVVKCPHPERVAGASCYIILKDEYIVKERLNAVITKIVSIVEQKTGDMYTYYVPINYEFRDAPFPMTDFGKVDFRKLEDKNEQLFINNNMQSIDKIRVEIHNATNVNLIGISENE